MLKKYTGKTAVLEFVVIVIAIIFMYPIFLILINSFKSGAEIMSNVMAFPTALHFENFFAAWDKMDFGRAFINTSLICVSTVALIVLFSSMAAYKIVRRNCLASKIIFSLLVFSIVIPMQVLMIPIVIVSRELGLINHLYGMVCLYVAGSMAMSVVLYSGFIQGTPPELEEAAMMDGAGAFKIFFRIVFPLLKPITASIVIMNVMSVFNDFMIPKLILTKNDLLTVQISMQKFYDSFQTDWSGVMAGLVLTIIPMILFFIICQRNIVESLVSGAVKG